MKQLLLVSLALLSFGIITVAQPKYEFRAAWIATVDNIDWPTRGNYNTESQKQEFIRLLDMHQRNGMNAVIAQIRPCTDAFYPSALEPWSEWLTGKQGKAPFPYYDPLQFMIEETHKRGMEFHAWCNPYRAEFNIGKSSIAPDHITKKHPEWFLSYGGKKYFDPGNKDAQQFVVSVIRDVVSRYDVDAIHFDDYFYPYRLPGKEFPDQDSYTKSGTSLTKDDWRRSNVDSIIVHLNKAIKEENPTCRFGISPFGVWRNKDKDPEGSNTKAGVTNYDDLYADILLWLKQGWIDYVAPQIYWEIGHPAAPFEVLVDWWSKHTYGKHCYIGLAIYRAGSNTAWKDKTQLPRMLNAMRSYPEIQGAIYFSSRSFEKNPNGWNDSLQNNFYKYPAVIPAMEWLDTVKPAKPIVVKVAGESLSNVFVLDIKKHVTAGPIKGYIIYAFNNNDQVRDTEDPKNILQISYTASSSTVMLSTASMKDKILAVSSLDINNNESELILVP
ncbi:MAG: hypothetical protein EOO02_06240 [Chitinophagaceae bacterium]|nr:MAG: hypothetical protein EOO02_06240 [Chitinophagaceae bacterium]